MCGWLKRFWLLSLIFKKTNKLTSHLFCSIVRGFRKIDLKLISFFESSILQEVSSVFFKFQIMDIGLETNGSKQKFHNFPTSKLVDLRSCRSFVFE